MLVSFPSQLCFWTSLPLSSVITVCGAEQTERRSVPALCSAPGSGSRATDRGLPVVRGGLLEGLVELELDLSGFEGALGLHADGPLVLKAHDEVRFGAVSHLPSGKSHTFGAKQMLRLNIQIKNIFKNLKLCHSCKMFVFQ